MMGGDIAPREGVRGDGDSPMAAMKTILLVDDDNEIIESMRTVLDAKGYRILVARDGNAGLTVAERENPDLIVLDMMMPKKSGFLVLEKLKSRSGGLIPTIMITGNEGSRHRAYAEFLGVKDYIRKPFAMEKLVRSIDKILGTNSPGGRTSDEA
jgi:DNA-binding response OmpR family regulator